MFRGKWLMKIKSKFLNKLNKIADEKEKILLYDAIDSSILKSIPNPSKEPYEIKVKVPEFTFLGVNEQPDFGVLYICLLYTSDAADE